MKTKVQYKPKTQDEILKQFSWYEHRFGENISLPFAKLAMDEWANQQTTAKDIQIAELQSRCAVLGLSYEAHEIAIGLLESQKNDLKTKIEAMEGELPSEKMSWTDVKEKYKEFHHIDEFTENMAIDVDFGYWLVNRMKK